MTTPAHAISWFEIPATDYARAKTFYEAVLGHAIQTMEMGPTTMGFLTADPNAIGGAIVQGEGCVPSREGVVIYLPGGDDLAPTLARAVAAGATVLIPKTDIGNGFGFFAHFMDTEGNRIGLHSMA